MSVRSDDPIQTARNDRGGLEAEIEAQGGEVRGNAVRCPLADNHRNGDRNPSGSIYRGDDGAWRLKCHSCDFCGDRFDLEAAATGRSVADVLSDHRNLAKASAPVRPAARPTLKVYPTVKAVEARYPTREATYAYTNPASDQVDMLVIRYRNGGKKRFAQYQPNPNGKGFVLGAPPKPWPVYNRVRVAGAPEVVVVEGEKCVHALHDAGMIATTSPGGAKKGPHADWTPLAGKVVYLWPDNDANGAAHMDELEEILSRLSPAPTLYRIDPAKLNLPEKGDAADYLANEDGALQDAVLAAIDGADPVASSSEGLRLMLREIIEGKRKNVGWGNFESLRRLVRALLPGTVTLLWGNPGDGKSFFLLQCCGEWADTNLPVAYFELEEDREFHLRRRLAQLQGDARLLDDEWMRNHPDKVEAAYDKHKPSLDLLAKCIWSAPERMLTTMQMLEWIEQRAHEGRRVIVVDPVSAIDNGSEPWSADKAFVLGCKVIARRYYTSIVLVSHPTKAGSNHKAPARGQMSELSGGSAYQKHTQAVLFVRKHRDGSRALIRNLVPDLTELSGTRVESVSLPANRSFYVNKSRNGPGQGYEVAFEFDPKTLQFTERGVTVGAKAWRSPEEQRTLEEQRAETEENL